MTSYIPSTPSPTVQLGSLDFYDIKNSIIKYLKTQDTIKDYDYAGSAAQVLLDVLAYNTMYYGHYANMIANEMFLDSAQRLESIISLVKPLGFVVPGRTSSKGRAKVRHGGAEGTIIPLYTRFSGYNENGTPFAFYTTRTYSLNLDGEVIVEIVEGSTLNRNLPLLVDFDNQKAFLHGLDIDISTITVEIKNSQTDEWEAWAKADNIESGLDSSSKVYWLERSELGFFIVFGGNVGASTIVQVGRQITSNDLVRVTYLKSSGKAGNGVGNFQIHGIEVGTETETISLSAGGSDEPNIDMIKFFAPKWFAAQDRAVTVEDCRALLAHHGFAGDASDPFEVFNVWGGEEMDPPMYGRVFVSVNDANALNQSVLAETIPSLLKEKTCVTILPEYMNPEIFDVVFRGNIMWDSLKTVLSREQIMSKIINTLTDKFPLRFENNFSASQLSNLINDVDTNSLSSGGNDFSFGIRTRVDLGPGLDAKRINFKTALKPNFLSTSVFKIGPKWSDDFNIPTNQPIQLRTISGVDLNGVQKLQGYYQNQNNVISVLPGAGSFIPNTGTIHITKGVASEPFNITCEPQNSIFNATQNILSKLFLELTLIRKVY